MHVAYTASLPLHPKRGGGGGCGGGGGGGGSSSLCCCSHRMFVLVPPDPPTLGAMWVHSGQGREEVKENGGQDRLAAGFHELFPSFFRTEPMTAVATPAEDTAVWEEWVFDASLPAMQGLKGGYWTRSSSLSVRELQGLEALCQPTSDYTPGSRVGGVQGYRDQPRSQQLALSETGSLTVLDTDNSTVITGFIAGMTSLDGYVPFGESLLRTSSKKPDVTPVMVEEVEQDGMRGSGALRYASSLVYSKDERHAYSIDFASDSITTVALVKGQAGSGGVHDETVFVDRRRHLEDRSRLVQVGHEATPCAWPIEPIEQDPSRPIDQASSPPGVSTPDCAPVFTIGGTGTTLSPLYLYSSSTVAGALISLFNIALTGGAASVSSCRCKLPAPQRQSNSPQSQGKPKSCSPSVRGAKSLRRFSPCWRMQATTPSSSTGRYSQPA